MKRCSIYLLLVVAHLLLLNPVVFGQSQNDGEKTEVTSFRVDSELLTDHQLVPLIINTPFMDDAERQEWFDLLATAPHKYRNKLRKILQREQDKLGAAGEPGPARDNIGIKPYISANVLAAVISAMGRGREERIAAIRPFLQSNEAKITVAAVEALGELGDQDSADQIQVLAVGGQPRVRVAALYALERIDRDKLLKVLSRAGHNDTPMVSFAAELIDRRLAKEYTRKELLGLVDGRDVPTGQWALSALRKHHTLEPGDISLLGTFLEGAPPELQQDIVLTLLHCDRENAVKVLGRIAPETAMAALFSADFDEINIQTARKAWLKREDIAKALVDMAGKEQYTQSRHRLGALLNSVALLRVEKAVPLLVRMFVDENRNRIDRGNIFTCLETFDREHVKEELQKKIPGAGKEAKEWIAEALERLAKNSLSAWLLHFLFNFI